MIKRSNYLFLFVLLNASFLSAIKFSYELFSSGSQCFTESVPEETLFVGAVRTSQQKLGVRAFQSSTILLFAKQDEHEIKFSFTTTNSAQYQFCIDNLSGLTAEMYIEINTGIYAKDYSGLASTTNIKPIEIIIKKEEDLLNGIQKQMNFLITEKETAIIRVEDVSYNIMVFSISTIVLMLVLSLLQMTYLKSFFKSKKLI